MAKRLILPLAAAAGFALAAARAGEEPAMPGYSATSAGVERGWETKFRAIPSTAKLASYMKRLTARPHHAGSPYDRDNAEWILSQFRQWGLDARIETFDVLFPSPKERVVELVEPVRFTAALSEPAVSGDRSSAQQSEQIPTYNAYSADGDVTAPLVYVNYGLPGDYEQLEKLRITVKGAIVIARYGECFRGIKPKLAAEHGAIGCLIYSDPRDDGYYQGDVFPAGPWRPKDGVQRGSILDIALYPGDPLTPGAGATPDARRLDPKQAQTIAKIPVLPISYADAQPLLAALKGPVAPQAWRGALPITYHLGPGPAKVHLKVKSNWDMKPIYDVIARIPGSVAPDQWIIRGNHHDAWVNGADDPVSALTAMLEEARGFGELLKQGWKPKRTVLYCAWDGEEEGLLGSTEWVEAHAEELAAHAAVYINSDSNGRGYLSMAGSHSLENFINGVAREVQDPEKQIPVWKRAQLGRIRSGTAEARRDARQRPDLRISALGSGSDYAAFLDHLGIASLNLGFGGEDGSGIYHSVYDDYYWYTHFSDSDFAYGRALAQTAGTAVLRLAGAEVLPFEFGDLSDTVQKYVTELQKLSSGMIGAAEERNREIREGVFTATADPKENEAPPVTEPVPPQLNFEPLKNGAAALARGAERYRKALARASFDQPQLREVNQKLVQTERGFLSPDGLPGRPWFRNQLYAPGFYTGYGVKTIPGVREAIEQKRWKEAESQITKFGQLLEREAALIEAAAEGMEKTDAATRRHGDAATREP